MPQQSTLYLIETHGLDDCCSSIPRLARIGPTRRPSAILRSLVIEIEGKVMLVDPGLGLFDWLAPQRRLGGAARWRMPRNLRHPRVLRTQLEQRGIGSDRVTDIVLSHAHPDVIGAISDFPEARIHLLGQSPQALPQVAHIPRCVPPLEPGTDWCGFRSHRVNIEGLSIDLLELPGHTPDHAGVLIQQATGSVLYLGGAITSLEELAALTPPAGPDQWLRILRDTCPFERLVTRERLRRLVQHPTTTLTFVFAQGSTPRFSVGPSPHPSIGYL